MLNALGYDAGPEDGAMGPRTRNALTAFQRDVGLRRTGVVNRSTLSELERVLQSRSAARSRVTSTSAPGTPAAAGATPHDGTYEAASRTAIAVTGDIVIAAGRITFANGASIGLRSVGANLPGVFAVDPPVDPILNQGAELCGRDTPRFVVLAQDSPNNLYLKVFDGPDVPAPSTSVIPQPGMGALYNYVRRQEQAGPQNRAGLGAERPAIVREAQTVLNALGFDAGPEDGLMGPRTRAALAEFQAARGLGASGWLDGATVAALREAERRGDTQSAHASSVPTGQGGPTISILGVTIPEPVPAEIPVEWHQVRDFVPAELLATPAEPLTESQVGARVSAMQAERGAEYERALELLTTVAAAANPEHGADFIRLVLAEWSISPGQPGEVIGDMRAEVVISDQVVLRPEAQVLAKSLEIERLAKEHAALTLIADEFGPAGMDPGGARPAASRCALWPSQPHAL
jgi:peptidoglycan hydrolase-like protein with peptidoglycan-binding domain